MRNVLSQNEELFYDWVKFGDEKHDWICNGANDDVIKNTDYTRIK
jgi:hypothetical protein